ncbi:hypothetical protein CC1G_05391 [Coprinopsis cinerea okayama7|uniref:WW domain-containing protein n=1 Tax=Coprinopsis cinerea (strain Okayama-7 / 130 / ATCC MYA-4618 / FGSC 9003) TaxID=240176 RepID=A8NPX8_COPC7|nr:hypothetical protein CC1G_05391 [Coprinopsis cinerea okayama7\|eukprot:XP_001835429.1 hypothetical protein CC1G_05391 [Coprinopsis cinerea okayama7\
MTDSPVSQSPESPKDIDLSSTNGSPTLATGDSASKLEGATVSLPPGYHPKVANDGRAYYWDYYTQSWRWTIPSTTKVTNPFPLPPLPDGWEERWDAFGRVYFEEQQSGNKQWAHPALGARCGEGHGEDEQGLEIAKELSFHPATQWRSRITVNLDQNGQGIISPLRPHMQQTSSSLAGRPYYINVVTDTVTWHEPIAPGCETMESPDGRVYYIDHYLKTSYWEMPAFSEEVTDPFPLSPLPDGWVVAPDEYGRICFVEKGTGRKKWTHPGDSGDNEAALEISRRLGFHPPENWRSRLTIDLGAGIKSAVFAAETSPRVTFNSATSKPLAGRPYYINVAENSVTWSRPGRNQT